MTNFSLKILSAALARDRAAWERLVVGLPLKAVYFTAGYLAFYAMKLRGEPMLVTYGDSQNYLVHPLVKRSINDLGFCPPEPRRYDVISPWYHGGPTAHLADEGLAHELYRRFLSDFGDYCRANGIVSEFVRLYPLLGNHRPLAGLLPLEKIGGTVYVDLSQSHGELWAGLAHSCRKNIKRAQSCGLEVRVSPGKKDLKLFYRVYEDFLRRKNSDDFYHFPLASLEELCDLVGDSATLFFVSYSGKTLAANLVLHQYDIAEDYLRGTYPDEARVRPNNILLYEIILWAKARGYRYFNIGGGRGGQVDDQFRFKATFSRLSASFLVYRRVHDQVAYDEMCRKRRQYDERRGIAPVGPGFFPAYRHPYE